MNLSLSLFLCSSLAFLNVVVVHTSSEENIESADDNDNGFYKFLQDSFQKDEEYRRAPLPKEQKTKERKEPVKLADTVQLPGGYNPLPGRTSFGDYWPLMPMSNQYHAALTYDTSNGRHVGGDILVPVPYWNNFLNIGGHYIERTQEEWVKVGYVNNPVNMLGLTKDQIARLMSDPSLLWNRQVHPKLPVGALPREYEPVACKPPMCNPYQGTLGVGVEANYQIEDGVEGEIDLPIPLGKDIAYRLPISGNFHYDHDDTSFNYGQNLSPLDPLNAGLPNEKPTQS